VRITLTLINDLKENPKKEEVSLVDGARGQVLTVDDGKKFESDT